EGIEMGAIVGMRALRAIEDQPAEPVVDLRPDAQENLRALLSRPAAPVLRAAGEDTMLHGPREYRPRRAGALPLPPGSYRAHAAPLAARAAEPRGGRSLARPR